MTLPERVVFDCNVFFQALTSPLGPAGRLLSYASSGIVSLYVSEGAFDELRGVTARPYIAQKYRLNEQIVSDFIREVCSFATCLDSVPHLFEFPRDPKDAHYVDLALAARAKLIVSRDKDLLSLRDATTADGRNFIAKYPALEILTPPEAIERLAVSEG
jgi:putative PIN family toxin of toxin-antitoxin system